MMYRLLNGYFNDHNDADYKQNGSGTRLAPNVNAFRGTVRRAAGTIQSSAGV